MGAFYWLLRMEKLMLEHIKHILWYIEGPQAGETLFWDEAVT